MTLSFTLPAVFRMEGREYAHFSLDTDFLSLVILSVCAGLLAAVLFTFIRSRVQGIFVRRLLAAGALSKETAKTLTELGYGKTLLIRAELGKNSLLTRLVLTDTEEPENGTEEPRYYIPEEEKYKADVRFAEKIPRLPGLILSVALIFLLAVVLIRVLPACLTVIDNLF